MIPTQRQRCRSLRPGLMSKDEHSPDYVPLVAWYLTVLGILNLILLNPLGLCFIWFGWGIRRRKRIYCKLTLGLCWLHVAYLVAIMCFGPKGAQAGSIGLCLSNPITVPAWITYSFLIVLTLLHLLPVYQLMHPRVREWFRLE